MPIYQDDPWLLRSEEFYSSAILKGICQYCKKDVGTAMLAVCTCETSIQARESFKDRIYQEAGIKRTDSPSRPAGRAYKDYTEGPEAKEMPL